MSNPSVVTTSFKVPGRNVQNLSHKISFDCQQGVIIPVTHIDYNPNERIEVNPVSIVRTWPALAPILSRCRCRLFAFASNDKNYVPNYLKNSTLKDTILPSIGLDNIRIREYLQGNNADQETMRNYNSWCQVAPYSLANHVGFGVGFNPWKLNLDSETGTSRMFSGHRVLTYLDVVRNYFVDRNQSLCYRLGYDTNSGVTSPQNVALAGMDDYFENQRWYVQNFDGSYIDTYPVIPVVSSMARLEGDGFVNPYYPDSYASQYDVNYPMINWIQFAKAGLFLKPYMPDINSAFASTQKFQEAIAASIVRLTNANTANAGIDMQSLLEGQKLYNFYAKVLATGGQMDEMLYAEYGVNVADDLAIPMFLKQWSFDLNFEDVVASADTTGSPLGSMAGRGTGFLGMPDGKGRKKHTLHFSSKHYGTLAFYFVIEPYAEYYQGLDPMLKKNTTMSKFWPSFDRVGWQPLTLDQLNAQDESDETGDLLPENQDPFLVQVGVQPAYTEYKGMVSRNLGQLATTMRYWTFSRSYGSAEATSGPSAPFNTYIMPDEYNENFALTDTSSHPFICSFGFDVRIKRPIANDQLEMF